MTARGSPDADVFDYVVIGSGAAGSIVAARLGEDPATRVCVLEAGPPDWHPWLHVPAGYIKKLASAAPHTAGAACIRSSVPW